jgi:Fe-S cluster assembly iron-binding protein IscA
VLQVSPNAVSLLEEARDAQDIPESFGIRVFGESDPTGQVAISVGFTEEPQDGDEVTEQSGTEIYVSPELAEPLSDSVLDLEDTPEGARLVIKPQQQEG